MKYLVIVMCLAAAAAVAMWYETGSFWLALGAYASMGVLLALSFSVRDVFLTQETKSNFLTQETKSN